MGVHNPAAMWRLALALVVGVVCKMTEGIPCEEARMRCAYRAGCGQALQNYLAGCSAVLQGEEPTLCPEVCQHSLVALTSTEQGKDLMECECSDDYCEDQKRRTDICRPVVMETMTQAVLPCRIAQAICAADAMCSTALTFYNRLCKAMFIGEKCTPKCRNSINILKRQHQAAKLTTCKCDGLEDYDCVAIQHNMHKLCHNKHHHHNKTNRIHHTPEEVVPTVVLAGSGSRTVVVSWIVVLVTVCLFT